MNRLWICLIALCLTLPLAAQTNRKIQELQERRGALQKEIAASEQMLLSTQKDVRSQLNDLKVLGGQIDMRRKLIASIVDDMKALDSELVTLRGQLGYLQRQLDDRREKYATSVKYRHKNRSMEEKLMFIFSAEELSQIYRRLRYVREYGDFQRRQAEEIVRKQQEIQAKQAELTQVRNEKSNLLGLQSAEQDKLEKQEQAQRTLVASLQKKQKGLQNELAQKRRQAERLNAQIDRLIEAEIAAAKKRAEEEARRRAAAAKKRPSASTRTTKETSKAAPMEAYKTDSGDRRLSATFERNKGILPVPITGGYLVVEHYGRQNLPGFTHVTLDNKGIDIKGRPGAQARAIFDGEVSAVFQYNGMTNVLVRHGSYISVYCNLKSTHVRRGQQVKTRDTLGEVAADPSGNLVLHFQLRKETARLNPEAWLKL